MGLGILPILRISQFVNMLAVSLILFVTACSDTDNSIQNVKQPTIGQLNAVWSTPFSQKTIRDIAVIGDSASMVAVAYDNTGLQIFDLNGEQVSSIAPVNVQVLSDGKVIRIDEKKVIIFLGIANDSTLKIYLYGNGLSFPVEFDFPTKIYGNVLGMCIDTESNLKREMRMAYWSTSDPLLPIVGKLRTITVGGNWPPDHHFIFDEDFRYLDVDGEYLLDEMEKDANLRQVEPFRSCWFDEGIPKFESTSSRKTTVFSRDGQTTTLVLNESGKISAFENGALKREYSVSDGITVKFPTHPTSISSLNYPTKGGYPNGAILVGGEISQSNSQVVFIDAGPILKGE